MNKKCPRSGFALIMSLVLAGGYISKKMLALSGDPGERTPDVKKTPSNVPHALQMKELR